MIRFFISLLFKFHPNLSVPFRVIILLLEFYGKFFQHRVPFKVIILFVNWRKLGRSLRYCTAFRFSSKVEGFRLLMENFSNRNIKEKKANYESLR